MNIAEIHKQFKLFIRRHHAEFASLVSRETALLEMGALILTAEHYRIIGFNVIAENIKNGFFQVKLTSRGYPYTFSWFKCEKGKKCFEIHSNLAVAGAHDDGAIYVVDVAVVNSNKVPRAPEKNKWLRLENGDLLTFAEVKKLVVYPMLLAQFVGIVHEICPEYLSATKKTIHRDHFSPALISLGYLKGTSEKIVKGFRKRKYHISIISNFDFHLSSLRKGEMEKSPFLAKPGSV